uniref:hypothetical protein ycf58 n=1 Tax=Nemalion vermiculare TaxID=935621 RepID=UPI00257E6A57|nr:hypothetical protein ycf58 [Nemalion vermiculare]WGV34415.1 hypothetical protein ycf58 [Nemalion vermiculare]
MPINTFLQANSGRWLTSRTVYMAQSKKIYRQQSELGVISRKVSNYKRSLRIKTTSSITHDRINDKLTNISYFLGNNKSNISPEIINIQEIYNLFSFLNKRNHLSTIYQVNNLTVFDKLWLVNPNLRLNVSLIYKSNTCISIAFSSDIKIA